MADPNIRDYLFGASNSTKSINASWDDLVAAKITELTQLYGTSGDIADILSTWHRQITLGYKHDKNFAPHINGFYMIFMVHGTWYDSYRAYVSGSNEAGLSLLPKASSYDKSGVLGEMSFDNPKGYFNMLATDIEVPEITEEYVSVSSRLRNSHTPSRNYFVSDFNISYIENTNLNIMRYHEGWHKYLQLLKRGEVKLYNNCSDAIRNYFIDVPYANAVWVAVFKPFTTDIQLLIKLIGVLPVSMPLKQVIGNRSQSKLTVLNISYKATDLKYKFYNGTQEFLEDAGALASSFKKEVLHSPI